MFGRGVISTLYGWALEKAGHEVEFYVRPGRARSVGASVSLDIRVGRTTRSRAVAEDWPVTLVESIDPGRDYDLIIVSVNHDQLDGALEVLRDGVGDATVLMFNNVWSEPSDVVADLPAGHVVWGFPGGGGGFIDGQLRGAVLRTIFLGDIDGSSTTARHRMVRGIFQRAGFSASASRDFRSWLWLHFIMDTALAIRALGTGTFSTVLRSRAELEQTILIARELIPVIEVKGARAGRTGWAISHLPAPLIAVILRRFLSADGIPRFIMEQVDQSTQSTPEALTAYVSEVLAAARRYQVPVPRLEEAAATFPVINDRVQLLTGISPTIRPENAQVKQDKTRHLPTSSSTTGRP